MAAREENILNVPLSETLEGMHVLCDTGDTGEPYRVAASLFIAEATQAAKDAVANLDPKDIILKGFTALTTGKPAITANSTLLAAIQSLYAMAGSGKVKIVSDGADQTGMVCWNGTSASGFVINVNEAAIYTRSQWTQASPDSVTDANWIAAVKTGGTKTPFAAAAQNPNMGDLPTNSRLKFVDNKTTILGMLKMLTAAANVGRLRIVSGNPATGASGKPELAFIVNIVQGANAETQGTNGLQIFHLTNDYIRVIPSSSVAMAWPTLQTLTDEAIITKLHSTASGNWGGLGVKLPWTGGSVKPIKVEDFTIINEIWPAELTPGTTVPFYAEGEMYSAPSGATDTAYVGQVILNADFATSGMATVVAYGNKTGRMYHAQLDFNGQSIDWFPSPVGTLTLTTFTTLTANASVSNMKIGEMLGFYSSNGGSTSGPGASPLFGYIQKTSATQVNIFAYTIDGKKSWLGYNAGSNVTWTPVGGASGGNVIHGEDITEGLEYLIPENVGDVVAFRSTMDSAQVPAEQEGFGFLAKVNGSESMAMMMQNDPAGGGKMKFFMGRVQNDGSGTDWQELTTGSSTGTNGPKVVFDDEFMFDGFNASHKGKLTLREPIPMGSIVTFYGSYSYAPPAEEYLLSPSTWVWSQTIPLPLSASNGTINIQNMKGIVDPSTTPLEFFQQMAIIQVTSDDVVDGKIKSFTAYATGDYSGDMWITVEKVIFECTVFRIRPAS